MFFIEFQPSLNLSYHLVRFLYNRCVNLVLNMQNYTNLGILGSVVPVPYTFYMVVPVPLVSVSVPVGFCWVVPVPPCFGTGTTL